MANDLTTKRVMPPFWHVSCNCFGVHLKKINIVYSFISLFLKIRSNFSYKKTIYFKDVVTHSPRGYIFFTVIITIMFRQLTHNCNFFLTKCQLIQKIKIKLWREWKSIIIFLREIPVEKILPGVLCIYAHITFKLYMYNFYLYLYVLLVSCIFLSISYILFHVSIHLYIILVNRDLHHFIHNYIIIRFLVTLRRKQFYLLMDL